MTAEPGAIERLHVATGDVDLATDRFQRAFPAIRLTPIPDGPRFGFDFRRVGADGMAVDRLLLTGEAGGIGSIDEVVAVGRVREGRYAIEYGRTVIDTTAPYLRPHGRSRMRMEHAALELIEIDPHRFAAAARELLRGSGQVAMLPEPEAATPISPELVPAWHRIVDLVTAIVFDADAFESPLIRAGLFELVITGMLATFPLTVEAGPARGAAAGSATIRRALDFVEAHLAEPLDTNHELYSTRRARGEMGCLE